MTTTDDHLPVPWQDLQRIFRRDGWLRDIRIESTGVHEWQRAYDYILKLVSNGQARTETHPEELPRSVVDVFGMRSTDMAWLHLLIDPIQINCHFFEESDIEFSTWPEWIASPAAAGKLFGFMEGLARSVGRPVTLRSEGMPFGIWLTFDPSAPAWTRGDMFKLSDSELDDEIKGPRARLE